ncbi:hypothetical protein NDGK_00212 [Clostridiales bacterium CHKCI001]|nr:hypothetical protein NDGK_00212 [Clostridiales bacterium CHKCI001]
MIRVNKEKTAQIAERIQEDAEKVNILLAEMEEERINLSKIWISEASDLTQEKMKMLKENCEAIKKEMELISDTIQSILQKIQAQEEMDLQKAGQL